MNGDRKMSIFKSIEKNNEQLAPLDIEKENGEGYSDPVTYDALSRLDEEARFHRVIKMIFNLLDLAGFYLDGRITIVSKKTGRIWR